MANRVRTDGLGRDFGLFWAGQAASVVANQVALFLLPLAAVIELQATSAQVGLINAAGTLAYPAIGLAAGWLSDRWRRRPVMIASDTARMVLYLSAPVAAALGELRTATLLGLAVAVGVAGVLFDVAGQSHLPALLPRERLATANSRLEVSTSVALLLGPAIGGLAVQWMAPTTAMGGVATLLLLSVAALLLIRTPEPRLVRSRSGSPFSEIRAGITVLVRNRYLRPTLVASALRNGGNAAAGTVALVFALRELGLEPGELGVTLTLSGVVTLAGAWLTPRLVARWGLGRTLVISGAAGVAWAGAPLALWLPSLPTYALVTCVVSVWQPAWNTVVTTLRQQLVPHDLLGRAHATARTINFSAVPVGALVGGFAAERLGSAFGARTGFVITFVVIGLIGLLAAVVLVRSPIMTSDLQESDGAPTGRPGGEESDGTAS